MRFFCNIPPGFVWNRRHTQHNGSFDPGETRCPSRKPHRTIDSVIDGFLQAVRSMKNKDAELVEFLDKFDGVCLEAKSDNVQEWSLRPLGAGSAGRSEEKHDLAYSAAAEFNVLADEVKAPFRKAARKECEAAVRAECAEKGIVNEEEIERRISSKVEMILFSKEGEIAPSRQLTADLLDLGFGMMHEGLPAVGRDPETGFLAAFAVYPCSRLVAAEFPGSFEKFVSFAMRLADRLEALRMVVVRGFGNAPMILLTNLTGTESYKSLWKVVEGYMTRWRVEEAIRYIKQSYRLEEMRLLDYQRLKNMAALVLCASVFASSWMGLGEKLKILTGHVIELSRRIHKVPEFFYDAIADGIRGLFARWGKGWKAKAREKPPDPMEARQGLLDLGFGTAQPAEPSRAGRTNLAGVPARPRKKRGECPGRIFLLTSDSPEWYKQGTTRQLPHRAQPRNENAVQPPSRQHENNL